MDNAPSGTVETGPVAHLPEIQQYLSGVLTPLSLHCVSKASKHRKGKSIGKSHRMSGNQGRSLGDKSLGHSLFWKAPWAQGPRLLACEKGGLVQLPFRKARRKISIPGVRSRKGYNM
jgi:hypothetical protein